MTLVKFNQRPFEGNFNNLVDDLFANFPVLSKNEGSQLWKGFVPVNIKETDKIMLLKLLLRDLKKQILK